MGRPSDYSEEMASKICGLLAGGMSLKKICDADDMPDRVTVWRWLEKHELFRNNYARARQEQADSYADEIADIADRDDLKPEDKRVRVDARKWVASKLKPKSYGDRLDLGVSGELNLTVVSGIPAPDEPTAND